MTSPVALSFYGASQLKFPLGGRNDKLLVGVVVDLCLRETIGRVAVNVFVAKIILRAYLWNRGKIFGPRSEARSSWAFFESKDWLIGMFELMWPYLDKAICKTAKNIAKPIIAEQIPKYKIDSVEFEELTLGCLPPTFQGLIRGIERSPITKNGKSEKAARETAVNPTILSPM
ncbi:hypothetical protein IFM89_009361 [Coptis chinensis]|uniref:SMP-LTD domain-containing protein n=1 Tax=Coptis chinensis TaxID=261450 RepID=A0A835LUZ0_9MAGN|nr:hypothetical protein IFM89_009361 [Coptis chinensis]